MSGDWTVIVDLSICVFIMLFLIGQRFNQWPSATTTLFSGKPSDYIDPFRYYTYYFVYVSTFLIVGVAIYNLQLVVPDDLKINASFKALSDKLGSQSWTMAALYLLALVNEKHVKKWDAMWRDQLQMWARIPKAVDEIKDSILLYEDVLTPTETRLKQLRRQMRKLGVADYWEPVIDNWQREREQSSLDWHYLKAAYSLRICKQLRVATIKAGDLDRQEKRLHDLARVLPKIDRDSDDVKSYMDEVSKLFTHFVEALCKHVIKHNTSTNMQRDALQNFGFNPHFFDIPGIHVFRTALSCLLCISIVCIVTIMGYLSILDWFGFQFRPGISWFAWERVFRWSLGSITSYGMAIFFAIIIEKAVSAEKSQPGVITYLLTLVFSMLVSLTFFRVSNPSVPINWGAYISLALSMGVVSIAVIRALTKPTCNSKKEVWVSSLSHAVLLGLIAALFQTSAAIAFRGMDNIVAESMIISAIYGFVKGSVVTFIVSALIQSGIRRQLIAAQRKTPRARFKIRLPARSENEAFNITTRNISRGGLLIEPGRPLIQGQPIDLNFSFGVIQAKVQWVSKKFAGLAVIEESPNVDRLHSFIRSQFGFAYA